MARFRPWPVTALVAWTLFTWGNRIPLLWAGDQSTGSKVAGTVPIGVFLALAVATLVALARSRSVLAGGARLLGFTLAGWSVAYWLVRLPLILTNDHPAAFKVVHAVLALTAVALSVWAGRTLAGQTRRTPALA